jgi:hypothetical protein
MIATLPLAALYLAVQNYFIEGVAGFALKGSSALVYPAGSANGAAR